MRRRSMLWLRNTKLEEQLTLVSTSFLSLKPDLFFNFIDVTWCSDVADECVLEVSG